jgi:hypothetical protein
MENGLRQACVGNREDKKKGVCNPFEGHNLQSCDSAGPEGSRPLDMVVKNCFNYSNFISLVDGRWLGLVSSSIHHHSSELFIIATSHSFNHFCAQQKSEDGAANGLICVLIELEKGEKSAKERAKKNRMAAKCMQDKRSGN